MRVNMAQKALSPMGEAGLQIFREMTSRRGSDRVIERKGTGQEKRGGYFTKRNLPPSPLLKAS